VLEPPPNGEAKFTLKVEQPVDIAQGTPVELRALIKVEEIGTASRRKRSLFRRARGNRLQLIMNEKVIYDREVEQTAGKFQRIKSEKTQFVQNPVVEVLQKAGDSPVAVTVQGLSLVKSSTPTRKPNIPIVISRTEPSPGDEETEAPPREPTNPPEATGEESVPAGQETTVPPPRQTRPPDVTGTEPNRGTQGTAVPTGPGRSGGGEESASIASLSNLRPETGTVIPTVVGPGTPTGAVSTPTGPVEIRPNEAGHGVVMNLIALYGVPLVAAILV
jgi:hypothetical protein